MAKGVCDDVIWTEILKRTDPKTIGKFMCVSKKYYDFMSSPKFINAQALYVSKKTPSMFLLREFGNPPKEPAFETYSLCLDNLKKGSLKTLSKFHCPLRAVQGLPFRIVGVVNGVILLTDDFIDYHSTFILWNPVVKKYIQLPQPRMSVFDLLYELGQVNNPIGNYLYASGFGFDSVSLDYKVVLLVYPQGTDGLDKLPPLVELYSVREGKWRSVDAQGVEYCTIYGPWSQCFMRGSVHWLAFERRDDDGSPKALGFKSNWLLLFDVEKEKFKRMKVPSKLVDILPFYLTVCEYSGMLAIKYCHAPKVGKASFDLWVKKIYDVGSSWTKLFSITTKNGPGKALYFRKNGEILLSQGGQGLVYYDLKTERLRSLGGVGIRDGYFACPYTESLAFLEKQSGALSYEEDSLTDLSRFAQLSTDEVDGGGSSNNTDGKRNIFWSKTWKFQANKNTLGIAYQMTKFKAFLE